MLDHSNNPKLHKLYVKWAYEELRIINETIDELQAFSRVNATITASALYKRRAELLHENTAYRDAAIMILCGEQPEEENSEQSAD